MKKHKTHDMKLFAHQLHTPLARQKWALSELLEGERGRLSDDKRRAIEEIAQLNESMILAVSKLIDLARDDFFRRL